MNDCPNAEFRDRLPDLLHERLDALERAAVTAHLESCADCRAELALLAQLRQTLLAAAPRMDVARIAAAMPAASRGATRRSWMPKRIDWRVAAAVTLLLAGGTSVATLVERDPVRGLTGSADSPIAAAVVRSEVAPTTSPRTSETGASTEARTPASTVELAIGGGLGDLDASDLRALLDDIEQMDVLPAEPEPVMTAVPTMAPEGS
jgi:anti-sigma factor RsiW